MLCGARTVKAKHIIFQHANCGSAASGPLRCGTQIGRCLRADFPICPQRRLPPVKGSNRRSEPSSTSVICFKPRCPVRQGVSHGGSGSSPPDEASRGVTVGGLSFPDVSGEVTRREGRSSPRTTTRHGWRSVGIGDWSCQNTARQKRRKQRKPPMRFYNMSQLWLARG